MKIVLYLCALPTKTHNPSLIIRKNIWQIQIDAHLITYQISTPQNCPGHQRQVKYEKMLQPKEAEGDMTTNVIGNSGCDSGTEKGNLAICINYEC